MYISEKKFSKIKKLTHTFYLQMFCALSGWIFELKHSHFHSFFAREHAKLHRMPFFFSFSCASLSFKGTAANVLWEKGISRRSKELKSDPRSCPLVWAPC